MAAIKRLHKKTFIVIQISNTASFCLSLATATFTGNIVAKITNHGLRIIEATFSENTQLDVPLRFHTDMFACFMIIVSALLSA